MSIDFAAPAPAPAPTKVEIQRDHYDRPLVVPPEGGKPVAYTRCTTYVDCLEDKFKLGQWDQRMVAIGLLERPDLLTAVASVREDKNKLNDICKQAKEAAKASQGSTMGTALHGITEIHDRGLPVGSLPAAAKADLDAYIEATADYEHLGIEQFVVLDDLKIGGTFDRLMRPRQGGKIRVGDIKTGQVDFGMLKIAMQLAVYAHSQHYDPQTGERTPMEGVDLEKAIVIHLPAGTGTCRLLEVDIAAGWEAVQCASRVRAWRAKSNYLAKTITRTVSYDMPTAEPTLLDRITAAATVDELTHLWQQHTDQWTDQHTEAATTRKRQLTEGDAAA